MKLQHWLGCIALAAMISGCGPDDMAAPPELVAVRIVIPLTDLESRPGLPSIAYLGDIDVRITRAADSSVVHVDAVEPVPGATVFSEALLLVRSGGEEFFVQAAARDGHSSVSFGPASVVITPGAPRDITIALVRHSTGAVRVSTDVRALALKPGDSARIGVTVRDSLGFVIAAPATFSSSDTRVAVVDDHGVVTATGNPGHASIRVSAPGGKTVVRVAVTREEDTFVDIAAGDRYSCGLTSTGSVYCWGFGNPIPTRRADVPMLISVEGTPRRGEEFFCGLTPSHDAVCWRAVSINGGGGAYTVVGEFQRLSVGRESCGIDPQDRILCWSEADPVPRNVAPQLRVAFMSTGGLSRMCLITVDGVTHCTPPEAEEFALVPLAHQFMRVATEDGGGACGLTTQREVRCWGNFDFFTSWGQSYSAERTCGGNFCTGSVALRDNASLASISAGNDFYCGLSLAGEAYCWGVNNTGSLGTGDHGPEICFDVSCARGPVPVDTQYTFRALATGTLHTCGVTTSGHALCWGDNNGRVGHPGTASREYGPVPVTGLRDH